MAWLDYDGLLYFWQKIKAKLADKVDKVDGKGLSTNDFSAAYKAKLDGIGYYSRAQVTGGFVHVDVRESPSRWVSKSGTAYQVVSKIMPTIRQGSKDCTGGVSYAVTVLQRHLGLKVDGIFGAGTKAKLVEWQKAHGLAADGICGMATWSSF